MEALAWIVPLGSSSNHKVDTEGLQSGKDIDCVTQR